MAITSKPYLFLSPLAFEDVRLYITTDSHKGSLHYNRRRLNNDYSKLTKKPIDVFLGNISTHVRLKVDILDDNKLRLSKVAKEGKIYYLL